MPLTGISIRSQPIEMGARERPFPFVRVPSCPELSHDHAVRPPPVLHIVKMTKGS